MSASRVALSALLLLAQGAAWANGAAFFPPFGLDLSARDPSVRPQDDFFQYANGAWIARTAIPTDGSYMNLFRELSDRVELRLRTLLEAAAADAPAQPATVEQKVGAMYAAFMDERRIEALGTGPIRAAITAVRQAPNRSALARIMGRSAFDFGGSIFGVGIDVDLKDATHYAVYLNQGGLGMPDRDYYLTAQFAAQKLAYRRYVLALLTLIGWPKPAAAADAIIVFETRIAKASWTKAEQRDLVKIYNPASPAELATLAPGFPWREFLAGAKLADTERVIVAERSAFPGIAAVFAHTPLAVLRAWEAFNLADSAAADLSQPYQRARFAFRDRILSGQPRMQPRWKRAIVAVAGGDCAADPGSCFGTLNWAVGEIYAEHEFTPETKAKVQQLVANVTAAFRARLQRVEWMGPQTKTEALRKLDTYTVKVGYPDHGRDYSAVEVRRDDLVGDVRRAAEADWDFYVGRSAGAVDRSAWILTPQTVDAYNGAFRDIVFPAAILQPPNFDTAADDAVNYGMIGVVIGHELTHGFDDQGRELDAQGELRDWWAPSDAVAFKSRAARLGAQYAAFEPLPGLHINPELTMGENIADLGGLVIALDAYHASLHGGTAPTIDGLSGDQRFFLADAQLWRIKMREDAIRKQTASDPHSFRRFRALGPIPNVDAWYDAFDVKPGDKMYRAPTDRVKIW
jgi:putative endopeptidase